MLLSNKNFYPTPDKLIDRMIAKIKGDPVKILDPSAGKRTEKFEKFLRRQPCE